jgi:hypothetical protein
MRIFNLTRPVAADQGEPTTLSEPRPVVDALR